MSATSLRLPPGSDEEFRTTEDLLEWMRASFQQYGDIYRASIYGARVYVINSPVYLEQVLLRNWRNYVRKGQAVKRIALSLGNGLISSNGDEWVRQRRMIQPAFAREGIRALFDSFVRPNMALLARWTRAASLGESVDVTQDLSVTVLEATLLSILGDDYPTVAPQFAPIADGARNLEFARTCVALAKIITQVAQRRRAQSLHANDILGHMMRAEDRSGARMPDAELARQGMTLVIAGHETTASVLNWIWYLLARHPEADTRLAAEIEAHLGEAELTFESLAAFPYAHALIEEALRIYPPLWLMTRTAIAADWLGEYYVPAGTQIYISPYLLQRHPALWEEPDRFAPDRFAAGNSIGRERLAFCPFGAGPRNCIGELFARVEMQVHLLLIARALRLRYETQPAGDFIAGVNLVSRDHFLMRPQARERHIQSASSS
jgi:cytochrome P450